MVISERATTADLLASVRGHLRRLQGVDPRKADGALVRATREALGLSQAGLARELGVHWNSVARWERGELAMSARSRHQVLQLRG